MPATGCRRVFLHRVRRELCQKVWRSWSEHCHGGTAGGQPANGLDLELRIPPGEAASDCHHGHTAPSDTPRDRRFAAIMRSEWILEPPFPTLPQRLRQKIRPNLKVYVGLFIPYSAFCCKSASNGWSASPAAVSGNKTLLGSIA